MIKVMFICHGNICRSPMAEFVFKDMVKKHGVADRFEIRSCATSTDEIGCDIYYAAKNKLNKESIAVRPRQAVQLRKEDYEKYDWLIGMDKYNVGNIKRIVGEDRQGKVKLLLDFAGEHRDVADPWYTRNFDQAYSDIVRGSRAFLDFLLG